MNTPLKILVNATGVSHDNPPRLSGNFYLAFSLVEQMTEMPDLDMHVATDSMTHPRFLKILPQENCHLQGTGGAGKNFNSILAMDISLKKLVAKLKPDVFHRPTGQLPFLRLPGCAAVSTVADLNFKTNKQYSFSQRLYKDLSYWWTFKRADRVTAISSYTASEIHRYYRYPKDKITVTHLGVVKRPLGSFPAALQMAKPYFLTFAQHSHKNCEAALRALHNRVNATTNNNVNLVVVGDNNYVEQTLKPLSASLGLSSHVYFVGYVDDDQLRAIYENASGLLFLSRHEGFGLPVVEAFWAGCPVIAANSSSLPEIVGDAGILQDPDDISGIAESMKQVTEDQNLRNQFIEHGRERAKQFSWENAARKTVAVYRQAYEDRAKRGSKYLARSDSPNMRNAAIK